MDVPNKEHPARLVVVLTLDRELVVFDELTHFALG